MIQLEVDGVFLDLYDAEPPKLNFAIEDITTTQTQSIFSRTFRLPATANNNKFFKHAFLVNGIDFDITIKRTARINIDGVLFREGELRLNKIYTTRENERIDYECIFLGETRSLATSIGDGALCDLNLSGLLHDFNYDNITLSWQAYPSGSTITDGLINGNVLYPLVDFGNTYDDNGNIEQTRIGRGNGAHFTTTSYPLTLYRYKPMIRAKYIWDKIFQNSDYTYTSTFLNSNLFNQLYVSAWGNNESVILDDVETSNLGVLYSQLYWGFTNPVNVWRNWRFTTAVGNGADNFTFSSTDGYYVVPIDGEYRFNMNFRYKVTEYEDNNFNEAADSKFYVRLSRTSGGVTTHTQYSVTIDQDDFNTTFTFDEDVYYPSLLAGDIIRPQIFFILPTGHLYDGSSLIYPGNSFRCILAPGQMNPSTYLDCEYKQIDFIKDIITKFRLVLSPDKNNPSNFIIEPWSDYIGSGDIFDWTDKLDVSKDFTIEPLFYTQKDTIEFRDTEDGDFLNELYFNQFNEPFGSLDVISNNELLKDTRKIETNFSPTPMKQIEGAENTTGGMYSCIIPQVHTHEITDTGNQHIPIKPNTRLLFYNGMLDANDIWYMYNSFTETTYTTYSIYPMVSPYSEFPITESSTYLDWEREPGYIQYDLLDYNLGSSVYEKYWSGYINSLYNKWARKITAYFILDSTDLQNFSFDDVIFVKDTYYYVNKIYDVSIGEKTSVKVELIKLIDFNVPTNNIIPLGNIWNEVSETWNGTTFTWND